MLFRQAVSAGVLAEGFEAALWQQINVTAITAIIPIFPAWVKRLLICAV
jgi:hypothetical protein